MENEVCGYCLLCVFKGLVCNRCLGSPLSECLGCTQIVIKERAWWPDLRDGLKPEDPIFFTSTDHSCSSQHLRRWKPCFKLVSGFPGNVSKPGKPTGRN